MSNSYKKGKTAKDKLISSYKRQRDYDKETSKLDDVEYPRVKNIKKPKLD